MPSISEKHVKLIQALCAEFVAMFIHTFWGSMFTFHPKTDTSNSSSTDYSTDYVVNALVPALQAGLAVYMIIVVFWKVCVINFNPAVTLGFVVTGVLSPWLFVPYVVMQLLGSVTAAAIAAAIKQDLPGPIMVSEDANIAAVICHELIITGIFVFFAAATVVQEDYDQATGPLAIGLTFFQGILGGRWIGGACMNIARAFGPALVLGDWRLHWVWWVGDLSGAVVFGAIYMIFFAPKEKNWMNKLITKKPQGDSV